MALILVFRTLRENMYHRIRAVRYRVIERTPEHKVKIHTGRAWQCDASGTESDFKAGDNKKIYSTVALTRSVWQSLSDKYHAASTDYEAKSRKINDAKSSEQARSFLISFSVSLSLFPLYQGHNCDKSAFKPGAHGCRSR